MDATRELQRLVDETGEFLALVPNKRVDRNKVVFDCWDVLDMAKDTYESGVVAWDRTPEGAVRKAKAKLRKGVRIPAV